ncbi:MAG: hypothetical protein IPL75_09805 [Acidobacteria bacterium]|nr:hypothetical protein [Acidobacteriota bacterium]
MRLTVVEQRELKVGASGGEELGAISLGAAGALMDLAERMGTRIAVWQSPSALRLQQYVGFVRVGDLQLEILPKLDALADPVSIRRSLLGMLAVTQVLEVQASELVDFSESDEPFIGAVARLYCRRLASAVRRGLRQEYVVCAEVIPRVRGKIDWSAQARAQAKQTLEFNCIFDERSEDTPLNRTLKGALLEAGRLLEGSKTASLVNELRYAMAGISDSGPTAEQRARIRTDRTSQQLKPLLTLAKLILGRHSPDLGRSAQGDRSSYAVVWDMNVLFEEYVGRLTRAALERNGREVELQESTHLATDMNRKKKTFFFKPDIVVRLDGKPEAVIDTKWKELDPKAENLGVSVSDIYQVLAYAHRYATSLAVLIYPHRRVLGPPGLQREFLVRGEDDDAIRVRVFTVDLSSLEAVASQLGRICTDSGDGAH